MQARIRTTRKAAYLALGQRRTFELKRGSRIHFRARAASLAICDFANSKNNICKCLRSEFHNFGRLSRAWPAAIKFWKTRIIFQIFRRLVALSKIFLDSRSAFETFAHSRSTFKHFVHSRDEKNHYFLLARPRRAAQ